jgi:hypothetical protein
MSLFVCKATHAATFRCVATLVWLTDRPLHSWIFAACLAFFGISAVAQTPDHSTQITLAGGNETKTLRVIKDAFDSAGAVDLTLLNFTFVGSPKGAARVEKWVTAVHGTFHSRLRLDP